MTNWIVGHTDRFAAASSQRSIADWMTHGCLSDIGYYYGLSQMSADGKEDVDGAWEQSPLKYARDAKTPTLFIHADQDHRCAWMDALQMFVAMRLNGVDTRFCLFKGESHDLSREGKPMNRIYRLEEIRRWFARYLKNDDV